MQEQSYLWCYNSEKSKIILILLQSTGKYITKHIAMNSMGKYG